MINYMTTLLQLRTRSRTWWSLGGTVSVHIALAALVLRQPAQPLIQNVSPHQPIEFWLRERPRIRQPEPLALSLPPPRLVEKRPPSPASAPAPRERLHRLASAPPDKPAPPDNPAPLEEPPQPAPRDLRKVDLLPGGVLRRLSEEGADAGPNTAQQSDKDIGQRAATARLVQERVQGFIQSGMARERVRSGFIDPAWRELEAGVHDLFKPPEALVRSGRSSMTLGERLGNQVSSLAKQILRSPGQVASGPLPRGEFAERGPSGVPENSYRNGLAAQQSAAVINDWGKPASWLRTEVELITTTAGEVESVRVLSTCGVKKLDVLAVEAVEKAARNRPGAYKGKRTLTNWAFESAYAANSPFIPVQDITGGAGVGIGGGFSFDETGLGRKNARGVGKYLSDPQYLAGGNIHTKVLLLSLQELPE